jgi:hypothetical protein
MTPSPAPKAAPAAGSAAAPGSKPVAPLLCVKGLRASFPQHLKSYATQELTDRLNQLASDPEEAELFRNGITSYANVLAEGRFKIEDYVSAVIYVSHKLLGCSNQLAWKKTFPHRHQTLISGGADEHKISAYVAAYNKNKLVNLILEQTLVPTWVLNADIYQKAINTQFEIMTNPDVSPKVRTEAANSILTHLKRPEVKKLEIDLAPRENAGMVELKAQMERLAEMQQALIAGGVSTQIVAHEPLVIQTQKTQAVDIDFENVEDAIEV